MMLPSSSGLSIATMSVTSDGDWASMVTFCVAYLISSLPLELDDVEKLMEEDGLLQKLPPLGDFEI